VPEGRVEPTDYMRLVKPLTCVRLRQFRDSASLGRDDPNFEIAALRRAAGLVGRRLQLGCADNGDTDCDR
jgi:hypothetical protein